MQMLQPTLAGRDYTLFGAPPRTRQGADPVHAGWRLTVSRARSPSPAEEEALYWDPCA